MNMGSDTVNPRSRKWLSILLIGSCILALLLMKPTSNAKSLVPKQQAFSLRNVAIAKAKADEFDQQFLSRLVSDSKTPGMAFQALTGEAPRQTNYTATVVIGRMSDESDRVQWVYDKLHNIQNPQIYIVDDNTTSMPHLDINHGREAAVYMKYIVENYESLPDISFFWHTDEVVWHNNLLMGWNSVEEINRMDRDNIMRQGYVPSRCDHWPGCPSWIHFNPSKAEHRIDPHRLEELFNYEIFSELFPGLALLDFPPYFAGTCCSQFAVSRDQIRSRPKEQYERLYNWAKTYPDDAESGRVFEYAWPFIFTGRGTWCPSMQECYCKTYNFCLENAKDLAALIRWNELRTRREEVQWQLTFVEDAMDTSIRKQLAISSAEEEVESIKAEFASEIARLTNHTDQLAQITWQAREDIIHYWKLPPPPVGW